METVGLVGSAMTLPAVSNFVGASYLDEAIYYRIAPGRPVAPRLVAYRRRRHCVADRQEQGRLEAVIPLYDDLRAVLEKIPKRSTMVLINSHKVPWTRDGFGSSFNKAKIAAGLQDRDLHFHDLRGTAATRFYTVGLSERVIAEIMGWEEEHVTRIIRRYVGRGAATRDVIRQINEAKRGT